MQIAELNRLLQGLPEDSGVYVTKSGELIIVASGYHQAGRAGDVFCPDNKWHPVLQTFYIGGLPDWSKFY